ncbi:MAG TPA: hypothetical protein VG711_04580, partial [Phycisphaerales bacterium]|nr:hypothetical protein [Phycisphaerales bacterium]
LRKHGGDTPRGQLLAIGEVLEEMFHLDSFNGCIFVNVSVEFPTPHDPVHIAAAEHKQLMEDLLREIAGYAGADDALALAREISVVMEGSYVTRQVTGRRDTGDVTKHLVEMAVKKRLGK